MIIVPDIGKVAKYADKTLDHEITLVRGRCISIEAGLDSKAGPVGTSADLSKKQNSSPDETNRQERDTHHSGFMMGGRRSGQSRECSRVSKGQHGWVSSER